MKQLQLALIFLSVFFSSTMYSQNKTIDTYFKKEAKHHLKRIAFYIKKPLWVFDILIVKEILKMEAENQNLVAILVIDENRKMYCCSKLHSKLLETSSKKKQDTVIKELKEQSTIHLQKPIFHNNKKIGILLIYFSNKEITKAINKKHKQQQ